MSPTTALTLAVRYARTVPRVQPLRLCTCHTLTLFRKSKIVEVWNKRSTHTSSSEPLDKDKADSLVLRLTEEERTTLLSALQNYQAKQVKAEYEGQLAAIRWRSKFGRPSKVPNVGDVDPTGSFCPVPEDWLMRKYAETVPPPTTKQLFGVALHNALPFVGFGFLDNAVMIIAGDYIDHVLSSCAWLTISTMAAAGLGNTFSDVLGIGSAWYVENLAVKVGIKPPNLSPIQLSMSVSRWAANGGRCVGVTIGCLLGMLPLLFIEPKDKDKDKEDKSKDNVKDGLAMKEDPPPTATEATVIST